MKKKHLLFLITFFYIYNSFSQSKKTEFGIKLGANYTIPSISEINYLLEFDNKLGTNFGIFMNYKILNKITIRTELVYSNENLNYVYYAFGEKKGIQKNSYINIPILIKYHFTDNLSVLLGPQIGFVVNGDERWTQENNWTGIEKIKDNLNISGNLGVSFKITKKIETELRYNFGLKKVNGFKHSVLQLNFGYTFW